MEGYSHEQLMQMYQALVKGQMPEQLRTYQEQYTDAQGKPIIDEEGGAMIQPSPGFVVKTKDTNNQKVFINMTHHELVDPFEEKAIPKNEAEKYGGSESGIRIPLSLGLVREDSDKKGEPA